MFKLFIADTESLVRNRHNMFKKCAIQGGIAQNIESIMI